MPLTRIQADKLLVRMVGASLARCGLDGSTVDGTNADFNAGLWSALMEAAIVPADIDAVADADLALAPSIGLKRLLDVAAFRCLEAALLALGTISVKTLDFEEKYGEIRTTLEKEVARRQSVLYGTPLEGVGLGQDDAEAGVGSLNLNFQQGVCREPWDECW